jgi:hypothetical protein
MNEKKIKQVLFSLREQDKTLNHSELYEIIQKFKNELDCSEEQIKKLYNEKVLLHIQEQNKIIEYNQNHNYKNEFSEKGIYSINDLFKFMNNNFEYGGVLIKNNECIKLPFGPCNGSSKNNVLVAYDDEYVVKSIMYLYLQMSNDQHTVNCIMNKFDEGIDICTLEEYQTVIYKVGEYVQKNLWRHRNVAEILNDQISNCYESSYLVGEFFKLNEIKYQKYIIGRYNNILLSHMFITYELNDKWYYFEHALNDFKGIFQYDSQKEMEQDIFSKFIYYDNNEMNKEIDFDNYFLKPIGDLDITKGFNEYFEYFNKINSLEIPKRNYQILLELTKLVLGETLDIGAVYNINSKQFYSVIELPKKEDFSDIELWYKKIHKIMRRKIINLIFYKKGQPNNIYYLDSTNKFIQLTNMIDLGDDNYRPQLLYNKQKIDNIFNMKDLELCILNNDSNKAKLILTFSMFLEKKEDLYEYGCYFTTNLSKTCISMISNNVISEKILKPVDISLSGRNYNKKYGLYNDNFLEQLSGVGSILEIMCKGIELVIGKNYKRDFINSFVDYLAYMIDINSIDKCQCKIEPSNNSEFIDEFVTKLLSKILS